MTHSDKRYVATWKKTITVLVLALTVAFPVVMVPKPALANLPVVDATAAANDATKTVIGKIVDSLVDTLSTTLINGANQFLQQMAFQVANSLVSSAAGQKPLFRVNDLKSMVKNAGKAAAGEMLGTLSENSFMKKIGLDLCDPGMSIRLSLQLGMLDLYDPNEPGPKCDFSEVMNNWEEAGRNLSNVDTYKAMWAGFTPGASPLSVSLALNDDVAEKINESEQMTKTNTMLEDLSGGGFIPLKDPVTGKVLAPAGSIKKTADNAQEMTDKDPREMNQKMTAASITKGSVFGAIASNALSTFVNTLVGGTWNKLVGWLLSPEEANRIAASEAINLGDSIVAASADETATVLVEKMPPPPILEVNGYDPITMMVACPSIGRSLFNCAADAQMANAVHLSKGTTMTIKTAIEKNMLHGDWPLISSKDEVRNTDPNCYSFGYCESNLKKLRAARIVSIGWEMAANLSPIDKPWTLKQVMDGYYDCDEDGWSKSKPFCHLIDPNWPLVQPQAKCLAQAYGPIPVSPSSDARLEQCVNLASCLSENDNGECIGGYGHCTRERNVWLFSGDMCPSYYNSCRTLTSKSGQSVSYNLNTVEYGSCNSTNAGCRAYADYPNFAYCQLPQVCDNDNGCICLNPPTDGSGLTVSCPVRPGERQCHDYNRVCNLSAICQDYGDPNVDDDGGCACYDEIKNGCLVEKGNINCVTTTGVASDTTDDWIKQSARHFTPKAQSCDASAEGCTALLRLGADDSLNLIRNGGFEETEDKDGNGTIESAKFWSPYGNSNNQNLFADLTTDSTAEGTSDSTEAISGSSAVHVGYGNATQAIAKSYSNECIKQEQGSIYLCTQNDGTGYTCTTADDHSPCIYTNRLFQRDIPVVAGKTYTISAAFKKPSEGNYSDEGIRFSLNRHSNIPTVLLPATTTLRVNTILAASLGINPDTLNYPLDRCIIENGFLRVKLASNDAVTFAACTFTIPNSVGPNLLATVEVFGKNDKVLVDNVMLEEGTGTSRFHEAYGESVQAVSAKVPPSWLSCAGEGKEAAECAKYAAACREDEVGCDLYTPVSGDAAVPAVVGSRDFCPGECAGYETYKRLATPFDMMKFPLYFIPATAKSCSAADVGCSEFTNLETEKREYFSKLRLCQKSSEADNQIFYTWEGSDTTGYQIKSWNLKTTTNNVSATTTTDLCGVTGCTFAGKAPCTILAADGLTCNDVNSVKCDRDAINAGDFDCREFYDTDGNRHFRPLSKTILATEDCRRYRITASTQSDCQSTSGQWQVISTSCIYQAVVAESAACDAQVNGCRAYHGNAAANVRQVFTSDFEGDADGWTKTDTATTTSLIISSEAIAVGGHSLKLTPSASNGVDAGLSLVTITDDSTDNKFNLYAGSAYTVTFWARSGALATSAPKLVFNWRTADGTTYAPATEKLLSVRSDWAQYQVGPFQPNGLLGALKFTVKPDGGITYLDNITLHEVQDNIYVVDGSWKTPASCDQTIAGAPSPQEMLGCRAYLNTSKKQVTLKSFGKLCREKAIGCAAYANTQNTPNNPYAEVFNMVCELAAKCLPTGGAASCPCHFASSSLIPDEAGVANPVAPNYFNYYQFDVCRVAPGEESCRFHLDSAPSRNEFAPAPDRVIIPADQRAYYAIQSKDLCAATDVGCRSFGVASTAYDFTCDKNSGTILQAALQDASIPYACIYGAKGCIISSADSSCLIRGTTDSCSASNGKVKDIDGGNGDKLCTISGDLVKSCFLNFRRGETSCTIVSPVPQVTKWNSVTLKDDPSKYEQTLCLNRDVGCESYSTKDGPAYFKDPGNQVCEYKEKVQVANSQATGWVKKLSNGQFAPCYPDYFDRASSSLGIYTNGTPNCALATPCTSFEGCDCSLSTGVNICKVPNGETTCGYQGWVGTCEPRFDRCEEFIDTMDVSAESPYGKPYYYIFNDKLNTKTCTSGASLKEGCVLFKRSSDLKNISSAAATYLDSELQRKPVQPIDCNANVSGDIATYCNQRCFVVVSGDCSNNDKKSCRQHSDCPTNDSGKGYCLGFPHVGAACRNDGDCTGAVGEKCLTMRTEDSVDVSESSQDSESEIGIDGQYFWATGKKSFPKFYKAGTNDTNILLNVRRSRQCARWFYCDAYEVGFDDNTGRYIKRCNSLGECEEAMPGQPDVCQRDFSEKPIESLSIDRYASRNVSWYGWDYSGYSSPFRYAPQYITAVDVRRGICFNKTSGKPVNDKKACFGTIDCGQDNFCLSMEGVCVGGNRAGGGCNSNDSKISCGEGYCSKSPLDLTRFAIHFDVCTDGVTPCDSAYNGTGGVNRACPADNNVCIGPCTTDADCPKPQGETESPKCFRSRCYISYGLTGGQFDPSAVDSRAACRAYPEQNSPFPSSIVTSYNQQIFAPENMVQSFAKVNACVGDNDCDCIYSRFSYGQEDTVVRYHALNGGNHYVEAICTGGDHDGVRCIPVPLDNALDEDALSQDAANKSKGGITYISSPDCRNAGGSCNQQTSIAMAFGWPGFCLDEDRSMLINNTSNQYNCLLWLPVDHLNGLPAPWDQQIEAAWSPPQSVKNLGWCTEGDMAKMPSYQKSSVGKIEIYPPGTDLWKKFPNGLSKAWNKLTARVNELGDKLQEGACDALNLASYMCDKDVDAVDESDIISACKLVPSNDDDYAEERELCDDVLAEVAIQSNSMKYAQYNVIPVPAQYEVYRQHLVAIDIWPHADHKSDKTPQHMYLYAIANPTDDNDWKDFGNSVFWPDKEKSTENIAPFGEKSTSNQPAEPLVTPWGEQYIQDQTFRGGAAVNHIKWLSQAAENNDMGGVMSKKCTSWGGAGSGHAGIAAKAKFDSNDKLIEIWFLQCKEDPSVQYDVTKGSITLHLRENCSEFAVACKDCMDQDERDLAYPQTQALYALAIGDLWPKYATDHESSFAGSTTKLMWGRTPEVILEKLITGAQPAYAGAAAFGLPIPILASEYGTDQTLIRIRCNNTTTGNDDDDNCPQTLYSDADFYIPTSFPSPDPASGIPPPSTSAITAGVPLSCNSINCGTLAGPDRAFGTFPGGGIARVKVLFAKVFATAKWNTTNKKYDINIVPTDNRKTAGNFKNKPAVMQPDSENCASDSLCQETDKLGFTVNGEVGPVSNQPGEGKLDTRIRFYAFADKNKMPLRRIAIDYTGAGSDNSDYSLKVEGYFRNRRGTDEKDLKICGSDSTRFDLRATSCDSMMIDFAYTYRCNGEMFDNLYVCDGVNYPCRSADACVYKPRVQVVDNWGVCNGACPSNTAAGDAFGICYNEGGPKAASGSAEKCAWPLSSSVAGDTPFTVFPGTITVYPPNN